MAIKKANLKIDSIRKKAAEDALLNTNGNRTKAAQILGVSVRTVRNWINRYELGKKFPYQRGRQI